jgi:hypothetical protein
MAIITITALGTLAVVARKQNADSLSTIALALAVLSFAAQLIITLAQSYNGTQQLAQADQVNAETKSSLSAIRATSDALLTTQRDQFSQVLHAALKAAVPAAVEDVTEAETDTAPGEESTAFEERVAALERRLLIRIDEALSTRLSPPRSERPSSSSSNSLAASKNLIFRQITTPPTVKETQTLLPILESLSSEDSTEFTRLVAEMVTRGSHGQPTRLMARGEPSNSLRNLAQKHDLIDLSVGATSYSVRLTPLGADVAKLVAAGIATDKALPDAGFNVLRSNGTILTLER